MLKIKIKKIKKKIQLCGGFGVVVVTEAVSNVFSRVFLKNVPRPDFSQN
jgi:hypothetical protein